MNEECCSKENSAVRFRNFSKKRILRAFYCVIIGALTIELKQTLVDNHERRQSEREVEGNSRSAENERLALVTVLCTLGALLILGLIMGVGVMIHRKCVKSSSEKKQRENLLRDLVQKTNQIERGLNSEDGEDARE